VETCGGLLIIGSIFLFVDLISLEAKAVNPKAAIASARGVMQD
jgi:hypothetical protein